ncbi:MAG: hypothetical protein K5927_04250 [Lachnospiraceae bacterium]|nr:hypothetical protein [Lachnospiraceae bacterium]
MDIKEIGHERVRIILGILSALIFLLLANYKSRDGSEKTFRGDKAYLGAHCERVYSEESYDTKIFIGFVATIIRNRIYTLLKDEMERMDKKQNFMTVPAALKELEKIELLKGSDGEYNLDYAVTATQKAILNAFNMTSDNVQKQTREICSDLARIRIEEAERTQKSDECGGESEWQEE